MPLGQFAAARTQRTTRPLAQAPDVVGGGGGGGGGTPTAPSDITVGLPASNMLGWGATQVAITNVATLTNWKNSYGFTGMKGILGGSAYLNPTLENTAQYFYFPGSDVTAVADPRTATTNGKFDWFQAYMSYGVPGINGGAYGTAIGPYGPKKMKEVFPSYLFFLSFYSRQLHGGIGQAVNPYMGDWFDDTLWTGYARTVSNWAAGLKFMNADGMGWDCEASENFFIVNTYKSGSTNVPITSTDHGPNPNNTSNVGRILQEQNTGTCKRWNGTAWVADVGTLANVNAKAEARGYQVGKACFDVYPNMSVAVYEWRPPGGTYCSANRDSTYPQMQATGPSLQDFYWWGWMRAMAEANGTGHFWTWDALYYRFGDVGAANTQRGNQGMMAMLSQNVSVATRRIMSRFGNMLVTWAGTDSETHYVSSQPGETTYATWLKFYRENSMDGWRSEYLYGQVNSDPGPVQWPGVTPAVSLYSYSGTNPPGGHAAGMLVAAASAATTPHPSTAIPTLSATQSGSGSTRTISGSAAHLYGVRWVRAYIYPSGTPVYAVMTFNAGGGTNGTNFNNAFMSYTLDLTGVAAGNFAIVQAQSTMGHQHSVVVAL